MNAACPCSAHAQNALSFGSGDTSLSVPNVYELRLLAEQIDDLPDEVPSNPKSREDRFVFRKDVLGNQPDESPILEPVTKK